jgi:hypothetical protein
VGVCAKILRCAVHSGIARKNSGVRVCTLKFGVAVQIGIASKILTRGCANLKFDTP